MGDDTMRKIGRLWILLLLAIGLLAGCTNADEAGEMAVYQSILPEEALQRLESEDQIILLDVRTEAEHAEARIPGSMLIPLQVLADEAPQQLPDQDVPLLVYCRSGRRSLEAVEILLELGYTQVYDLGGMIDWPYEVESD